MLVELDHEADRQELADQPRRPARHVAARRRHGHRAGRGGPRARVPRRAGDAFVHGEALSVRAVREHLLVDPRGPARGAVGVRLLEAHADRRGVARGQGGVEPPRRAGPHLVPRRRILPPVAKNAHPQASIDWASAEVRGGEAHRRPRGRAQRRVGRASAGHRRAPGPAGQRVGRDQGDQGEGDRRGGRRRRRGGPARHLLDGAVQQANADFAPEEKADAPAMSRPRRTAR